MKTNSKWEMKKLGEVCNIELGKTPYRDNASFWDKDKSAGNVWLSIADLLNARNKIVLDSKEYISDKGVSISKVVKKGTLLLSFKLTLGRLAFAGKDLYTNEAIAALGIICDKILKEYLYYYLSIVDWDSLVAGDVKVKGKTLNKKKLYEIKVYYPAISEQKRIVSKLDKLFENTKKLEDIAKRNLQNSKDIFNSVLKETLGKTLKHYEMKKLGEVCDVIAGQSPDGKYYNNNGNGLAFYQGKKEFTDKYVGCPAVWTTKITKEAKKGDILMSVRAPVGPINFATKKICIGRGLAAIRPINEKEFSNDYLFLFLISIQDKIKGSAGAVFASINKKQMEDILVPAPPINEQKRIIEKLDELSSRTKKLEVIYQKKIDDLSELKKSVLKRTFCC